MSYIGATGLTEYEERFDTIEEEIDSNATYINTLVGIPDPIHLATFGINVFNPSLYGLVERAEVNIGLLQSELETEGTTITGIQEEITAIQDEITLLQGEITGVQGEISVIDGDLLFLNTFTLPAMVSATSAAAVLAADSLVKSNKSLSIWDESGDNVYHKKVGNVGIGTTFGSVLNNKLEVGGSVNISAGSKYKINNVNLAYSDLAGTPPVSSKWTNATDVATNIYYSTGNVGIGVTSAINNKLEVGGSINISAGSKYKINNVDLSYNDLTNKLTQGTNISIVNNVINNTYELPTATSTTLGSVRPDNSTITISNGILSAAAGATQVNSDWTQTNTSLKSFIQNKPSAGNNISFANNSITNTITGSPTQNIIGLNTNQLIVVDKPNSQKIDEVFIPLTNEPYSTPSVVPTTEGNPITHKTLNFAYDLTKYTEYQAQQKTGVGGWRIVRFLPANTMRWYQGNYITTTTFSIPTIGTPYNYTNEWAVSFGTFNEMLFATFDMTYWLQCLKTSVLGDYGDVARPVIKSSQRNYEHSVKWYNRTVTTFNQEDPWISINDHNTTPALMVYGENSNNGNHQSLLNAYGGMCVLVRDSTASTTIPNPNQYTLSVPLSGTGVIINNTTLQYLSAGNYTISVGSTQSSVVITGIGQVGSDPYPSQNGSTITFKYSMTQKTQSSVFYKKDGLIKYVSALGTNPSTGTWNIIDLDSQLLSQFAGNLPFTRIDGNLPASRIDNLALSLGMDLTGVNGATQIKLTSAIVVVQGNLYSTGVNYFKYNVWHLDSDGFERFYFQQSNTTYIKGHGTTPFEFRNGANANICTISGGGGLAVASYLQGAGAGGGFRLVRPDAWVRIKSTDETTHLNFAAQNIYAYGTLDAHGTINLNNFTYVRMQSIANTGNELVCVIGNDAQGEYYNKVLYIAYGTFTGFHRCYVEDELCNDENVDIFKNEYIGRVVISTGKIKTDASRKKEGEENQHEWYSLEGKEGITIEDALPIIQLSRNRKDKRVYGVLGDPKRGTNNNSRIIVNGCGEGAICVANTNGNIENGDYIQTSDLLGYGERQNEPQHYNYTIAKAVMDCTFELDNPNYECKELSSGVRVAMIACVYKAS